MDTRTKILGLTDLAALIRANGRRLRLVSGYFDPLLAEHARRLEELAAPDRLLVVLLRSPAKPLLDARARAELVAAIRTVDYVVVAEEGVDPPTPEEWVREEEADERRTREFMEHVRSRH